MNFSIDRKIKSERAIEIILKTEGALFGKMVIMTKNIDIDIYIYNLGLSLNPEHFRALLRKKEKENKSGWNGAYERK